MTFNWYSISIGLFVFCFSSLLSKEKLTKIDRVLLLVLLTAMLLFSHLDGFIAGYTGK